MQDRLSRIASRAQTAILLILAGMVIFEAGFIILDKPSPVFAQGTFLDTPAVPTLTPVSIPVPGEQGSALEGGIPDAGNDYTPLSTDRNGFARDIVETGKLSASRTVAEVGDGITFFVTLQNQAPFVKKLYSLCFGSTDGNLGCLYSILLSPGQMFTASNVGTWMQGGEKTVWATWAQDIFNFYLPARGNRVTVNILEKITPQGADGGL